MTATEHQDRDDRDKTPGPDPERLKVCGDDWEKAAEKALEKKKPKDGWPKEEKGGQR